MNNKIIKEDDAIATIKYIDKINIKDKIKLDNLINKYYENDDCEYILQLDTYNYKGDIMCLCSMGNDLVELFNKDNFISKIKDYTVYDKKRNLFSNILKGYK